MYLLCRLFVILAFLSLREERKRERFRRVVGGKKRGEEDGKLAESGESREEREKSVHTIDHSYVVGRQ